MMDKIERCFKGSKEIPARLLRKNPSIEMAKEHLEKAEHNLLAMEKMFENKFFDWTIVTAYYSMYHAVLSALWLIGLDARSHECAVLAFERFYSKQEKVDQRYIDYLRRAKELSKKYSETLEKVRTMRINASYGIGEIKSADANFARSNAKDFVSEVRRILDEEQGIDHINLGK
ncbi:MAG: HEPN domain-containing protein [Candidatus Micrarchaeia archaeon]